jgi:intracellular multiplication protein IcmB
MKIIEGLFSQLDLYTSSLKKTLKTSPSHYSNIDTAFDDSTVVSFDGSFVSMIKINGNNKILSEADKVRVIDKLDISLSSLFKGSKTQADFCFYRNKDNSRDVIEEKLKDYIDVADKIGFKKGFLFDSKVGFLPDHVVDEGNYVVLWTPISSMNKREKDLEAKDMKESLSESDIFITTSGQDINNHHETLYNYHIANVETFIKGMTNVGISTKKMDVNTAIRTSRKMQNEALTSEHWEPILPSDDIPLIDADNISLNEDDPSHLFWPSLSEQIVIEDFEYDYDVDQYKIGDRYFSSVYIKIPPKVRQPFNDLIDIIGNDIPFRIKISLTGDGLDGIMWKDISSKLASMFSSKNKNIKNAISSLKRMDENNKQTIVNTQIVLTTWSNSPEEVNQNRQVLFKKIQSWGKLTAKFENADPIAGFLTTIPMVNNNSLVGTSFLAPLSEMLKILPLDRANNLWDDGFILFRTADGKLMPFQPMSTNQKYWNDIIFAPPGSGKSVLLQLLTLAKIFSKPLDRSVAGELPYLGIIDVGFSSRGLIKLLKDNLPDDKKHQVVHRKIINNVENAINVFDTHVGCRKPDTFHNKFLVKVLLAIISDDTKGDSEGLAKMMPSIIQSAYRKFSDKEQPKYYEEGKNPLVNKAIAKFKINATGKTWWQVVDALAAKKSYRWAKVAQRYAVPTLEDLAGVVASDESIKDMYKKKISQKSGESFYDMFLRGISEATKMFPCLKHPTAFDLDDARIIALDLEEVVSSDSSDVSSMQTASIMYMLSRHVIAKNFFLDYNDIIRGCPKSYHDYHKSVVTHSKKLRKSICYDEFHNASPIAVVTSQVKIEQRQGRKNITGVTLSSQVLDDFDSDMVKLSSSIYILGTDDPEMIRDKLNLRDSEYEVLKNGFGSNKGPGVPFMVVNKMKEEDRTVQVLYNTLSPEEIWSFNSTNDDNILMSELEAEIGSANTKKVLVALMPQGNTEKYMEKLEEKHYNNKDFLEDRMGFLKKEAIKYYKSYMR